MLTLSVQTTGLNRYLAKAQALYSKSEETASDRQVSESRICRRFCQLDREPMLSGLAQSPPGMERCA